MCTKVNADIAYMQKYYYNGKFHDMPEKDAGGGRKTEHLFGVALDVSY